MGVTRDVRFTEGPDVRLLVWARPGNSDPSGTSTRRVRGERCDPTSNSGHLPRICVRKSGDEDDVGGVGDLCFHWTSRGGGAGATGLWGDTGKGGT